MTIGERISQIRKENGLSQDAFGAMINVSRQSISKWEANISIPEVDKIIEISKKFNVSIEWLLGTKENRNEDDNFSEDQLTKIEDIIKKHSSIKQKNNITGVIISVTLITTLAFSLVICGFIIKNKFSSLWWDINSLYFQIEDIKDRLDNQNDYLEKVETSLNEQKELIVEEIIFDQYDLREETAHLIAKIRPKEYRDNIQIYLNVDNGINIISNKATEIDNHVFYVDMKIQLTDTIKVSGNIINYDNEKYVSIANYENKLSNTYYIPNDTYAAEWENYSDDEKILYVTNELYTPDIVNPLEIKKIDTYIFANNEYFGKRNALTYYDSEMNMMVYKTVVDVTSLNHNKKQTFEIYHVLTDSHGRTYVVDGQKMTFSRSLEGELSGYYEREYQVDKNFNWKQYE